MKRFLFASLLVGLLLTACTKSEQSVEKSNPDLDAEFEKVKGKLAQNFGHEFQYWPNNPKGVDPTLAGKDVVVPADGPVRVMLLRTALHEAVNAQPLQLEAVREKSLLLKQMSKGMEDEAVSQQMADAGLLYAMLKSGRASIDASLAAQLTNSLIAAGYRDAKLLADGLGMCKELGSISAGEYKSLAKKAHEINSVALGLSQKEVEKMKTNKKTNSSLDAPYIGMYERHLASQQSALARLEEMAK